MEDVPFATNRRIENCYLTIWGRAAISARMEHGLERERPEWCKKAKVFLFETILICVMRFVEWCCVCVWLDVRGVVVLCHSGLSS